MNGEYAHACWQKRASSCKVFSKHQFRTELALGMIFSLHQFRTKGKPQKLWISPVLHFFTKSSTQCRGLSEWCWYRCFVLLMILLISSISIKLAKYVHFNTCIYFFQIATNKLSNLPRTTQILKIRKFQSFFHVNILIINPWIHVNIW